MVENVEQIEARLAAYIDDELTPDERVELERHLDANPSHRALIRELTGHRDLLRALPREPAPADLSEPLEGAMERDALLGGGDPLTEYKVVRNRRWWPQLLAAAAIFVLAFGLAAIVFYVLPPKHPTVSLVQPPEPEGVREERVAREKLVQDVPPQVSANFEVATAADRVEDAMDKSAVAEVAATALFKKSVEAAEPATSPDTLIITITADNPQQASTDLLSYFSNNGISFSEVANPETWGNATAVVAGEESGVQLVMRDSAGAQPENAPLARQADRSFAAGAAGGGAMRDTAVATPAPAPSGSSRARRTVRSEPAAVPTTLPSAPQEAQQREARTQVVTGTATGTPAPDRYVVLASLNGTQAERLADTLGRAPFARRTELRREPISLPIVATSPQPAPAAPRPARGIQVGLASKVTDAQDDEGEAFKLLSPATKPADPAFAWTLSEEAVAVATAPTSKPAEPFAFALPDVGRTLDDAQVFNCVVVVRKPESTAPPATGPAETAAPTTRPIAP